jgi:hypothetical protein
MEKSGRKLVEKAICYEKYSEKRKIPRNLVKAMVRARETSEVQERFQQEMKMYTERCRARGLKPTTKWLELLSCLADGQGIMTILDALQMVPDSEDFLKFLEALKAHGFPEYFIDDLISEIPSDSLSAPRKDKLRSELGIYFES